MKCSPGGTEAASRFADDGFVVLRQLLDAEETELLQAIARRDPLLTATRSGRADGEGGAVDLVVENGLADDDYLSAIVRSQALVEFMEELLGDEVYHYHHKLILKEPLIGGAWTWHQDYGYWYSNGCLFPDMASCMIAVDRATRENGCLQVLKGSQRMGRVDHVRCGDQTGADPERVQAACERMELVHVQLDPGDAVVFHGNLLHRSDQNRSIDPRWAFICCYNTRSNSPIREGRHPLYSPLQRLSAATVRAVGIQHLQRLQGTVLK